MDVKIYPSVLKGTVEAPPSKSAAHRLIICAALSDKPSVIEISALNKDIEATIRSLNALGAEITRNGACLNVKPIVKPVKNACADVGESGSTLRFLIPVCAALGAETRFSGEGRLPERPLTDLLNAMTGCSYDSGKLPLTVKGVLEHGVFSLPGDISSQYISGLLFACPLLKGDSNILLTTKLQSAPYVDMTISSLNKFSVSADKTPEGFFIKGGQKYISPGKIKVEGDYSAAAFWVAAGAIGGNLKITGLDKDSLQGDAEICSLADKFGAVVKRDEFGAEVNSAELSGLEIDAGEIPDLVPALSVIGAFAKGRTVIYNAARLRIKESDRLKAMADNLKRLGAVVEEKYDSLIISGGGLSGGTVSGYNDHRIVMSCAVAAAYAKEPVIIEGAEAVEKSYPLFFEDYKKLGGKVDVINNRR